MSDRKTSPGNEVDELGESRTMEYVRELVANLDPEILQIDPEDAPTIKL